MKEFIKALMKEMMTPLDGKKPNLLLNGFVALILAILLMGVMTIG